MTLRGAGRDNTNVLATVGKKKHISGMRAQTAALSQENNVPNIDVRRRKFVRSNSLSNNRIVKRGSCSTRINAYKATINDDVLNKPKKQLTNDAAEPLQRRKHFNEITNDCNLAQLTDYGHGKENIATGRMQRNTFHEKLLSNGFPEKREKPFSRRGLDFRCANTAAPVQKCLMPRRSSSACATIRNPITSTSTILI